jgi:hypothetical protein
MLGLVACAALVLGACAQSNTPTGYNELTNQNFLETCTNLYYENIDGTIVPSEPTGDTVDADATGAEPAQCQCAYEVFTGPQGNGEGGMTIEDFTELNNDLKDDPNTWSTLPQNIKDGIDACGEGGSSTTSTTAASTTTTAG